MYRFEVFPSSTLKAFLSDTLKLISSIETSIIISQLPVKFEIEEFLSFSI